MTTDLINQEQESDFQDSGKIQYNDYSGYFDSLESEKPFRIPANVKLFKNMQNMIDEYFVITAQQDIQQIKKNELILEVASTLEQCFINSGEPHLITSIASSIVFALNKKDKITSPTHIYDVLDKKYKNRYTCERGNSKKNDIFSKGNVRFKEFKNNSDSVVDYLTSLPPEMESQKVDELQEILNKVCDIGLKILTVINKRNEIKQNINDNNSYWQLPEENENGKNNNYHYEDDDDECEESENNNTVGEPTNTNTNVQVIPSSNNSPLHYESKYFKRLGEYITVLTKIRENVLRYPPSKKLDEKLDKSLEVEIELLSPSIDMKFKRSIPQLDETIQYADSQSLNGASSVMYEEALIRDDNKGNIPDPNSRFAKFLEITHKLTPEQIDTRRPYISIIRKKMQKYSPHLFYHLYWYEGSKKFAHMLSMGKFARANLLRKKN